jgi:metal-responsive CopG/Arc/MetJ family transcriptional regulator
MKLKGVVLRKPKASKTVRMIISLPKVLKARLDKVQETGHSISGFVRVAITKALDQYEKSR